MIEQQRGDLKNFQNSIRTLFSGVALRLDSLEGKPHPKVPTPIVEESNIFDQSDYEEESDHSSDPSTGSETEREEEEEAPRAKKEQLPKVLAVWEKEFLSVKRSLE